MTSPGNRFWAKVEKTESCWLWTAAIDRGYARFTTGGKTTRAHRIAYEQLVGPIPTGLTLDHLCRVRHCVNPDHLEPVTLAENHARRPPKTHCPQGHAFTPENTYLWEHGGSRPTRRCRTCNRNRRERAA